MRLQGAGWPTGAQEVPPAPWTSSSSGGGGRLCLWPLAPLGAAADEMESAAAIPRRQSSRRFLRTPPDGRLPAAGQLLRPQAQAPPLPGRADAVLRRLAQIESKIRQRQSRAAGQDDEEEGGGLWSPPSRSQASRGAKEAPPARRGSRPPEDPGSDSPEAAGQPHRHNSSVQSRPARKPFQKSQLSMPTRTSLSPPIKKPSPPGRSSPKRLLHRAPTPPSRNTPVLNGGTSSLSSSLSDSLAGRASPKANERSVSEGSIIRSLDELFSGPASRPGSSSSDFKVNVLSLADLAPGMADQKEGLTEEATVMESSGSLSMELEQSLFFADTQSAFQPPSATVGKAAALVEDPGETEISEQLSGSSVERSNGERENPTSAQYSDSFDSLSEDTQKQSSSEDSRGGLDAPLQAELSDPSSPCLAPAGTKRSQSVKRITTKEAAVQTNSSLLTPDGLKTAAAAIDWIVEGPTASSHVVSMEALEELTTYRPAVSALNDMLKQNLLLIQQFVEASRHLHLSFVALLEEEEFHYHTLEEAKRYIDHRKCPPLTLESALHKLEEQKRVAV